MVPDFSTERTTSGGVEPAPPPERINGPLVAVADLDLTRRFSYQSPEVACPICGAPLAPMAAWFYGGIVCGVTWTLRCPVGGEMFEWEDATSYRDQAPHD